MSKYSLYYDARGVIQDIMYKDLIGPVLEDEILIELPTQYYTMGKLYPNSEEQEVVDSSRSTTVESEVDNYDISLASTNLKNPSSMGITFTINEGIENVNIVCEYAIYKRYDYEKISSEGLNVDKYKDDIEEDTQFWVRERQNIIKNINIREFKSECITEGINLKLFLHKEFESGEKLLTMVLVNENTSKNDFGEINEKTILQPHIKIQSIDGQKVFTSVMRQVDLNEDSELLEMDLLYKDYQCYAQGHGCSVNWDRSSRDGASFVETSFLPGYNLLQMQATQYDDSDIFNMKVLFSERPERIIEGLRKYVSTYDSWINSQCTEIEGVYSKQLQQNAISNMNKCRSVKERIGKAVSLLEASYKVSGPEWKSFVYSNEAMYEQRKQNLLKNGIIPEDSLINWYPFQLAFLLQEIISIVEPRGGERKLVDLLWFPTGGGKTEAYLGIAAFTIFYRKLVYKDKGKGLSVIMRYTLRLLTIQQFERASSLICACDKLREKYNICNDRITIGLWVGNELTPSDMDKANRSLRKQKAQVSLDAGEADPCQIKICPWCGEVLDYNNYAVDRINKKMHIVCGNTECHFGNKSNSLPIVLIDEEIYKHVPTFIVATVDKFAQITMKSETGVLFGVDVPNLPPDLIIQDELHLISGPLGTMTGIYEAAITKICERDEIPIKVIASTATIRNAAGQIKALYGREYSQFPPQGISIDDSFFAHRSTPKEKPARLYLGIMGVGATFTTTLIRVYASWLFASRYLMSIEIDSQQLEDKVIDNFWTLTGYFNSLRELGGATTQVVDDIQSRYKHLKDQKFAHLTPVFIGNASYSYAKELTSRMSNDEISEMIQKELKKAFTRHNHNDVFDFVLASNMISVGVDVGRLGTMAVAGQPKTNSEYIQATSRVGRDNPGLVFTIYNPSRSRDRSHYEQFLRYHIALYRYVEATSLTPFSDRARDRGLQSLFVILCRYLVDNLRGNAEAANFDPDSEGVSKVEQVIYEYVKNVDLKELDYVIDEIQDIKDEWFDQTSGGLYYRKRNGKSLLKADTEENNRFRTMNSMRSVENQSGIWLMGD